jgi:hypothetical protein
MIIRFAGKSQEEKQLSLISYQNSQNDIYLELRNLKRNSFSCQQCYIYSLLSMLKSLGALALKVEKYLLKSVASLATYSLCLLQFT